MLNLSENYRLRKCFLKTDTVPALSMIEKKMCPALANVYFKSMTPQLKVIAGLEPPLQGGGTDWIVPPADLLKGRTVLKPLKKEHMARWGWEGVDNIGMDLVQTHKERMLAERDLALVEYDRFWQMRVTTSSEQEMVKYTSAAAEANTDYLQNIVCEFEVMYIASINKLQSILFDAAVNKIKTYREELFKKMHNHYEDLLKQQATMLYHRYNKRIIKKKTIFKKRFIRKLEETRTELGANLHDINVEKHVVVEKLRHFLECQTLACQAYIAMKERQECAKEMESTKLAHTEKTTALIEGIQYRDFELLLAEKKEQKHLEFEMIWKKKVCHVVKQFQTFVLYCLNLLPEHAEFFINMEKLMLLQLSEALENPKVDSIIIMDSEPFHTPIPRPHPFYLFCDKGYKPKIDQDLCPKHCTSSASHLPVIVIDKRFIYAACDNFEQFTDRIKDYVHGKVLDDNIFKDHHDYSRDVPVKYTTSIQLQELKLEDSLLQILQQEIANARGLPVKCGGCKIPHCFYCSRKPTPQESRTSVRSVQEVKMKVSLPSIPAGRQIKARKAELLYQREPKWESYTDYVKTKKCDCAKLAKKHLFENLPIYMRKMSTFEEPELLQYEVCSVASLKALVKKARGKEATPPPSRVPSKVKDVGIQYSADNYFDYLCTCFSDDSTLNILHGINEWSKLSNLSSGNLQFRLVGDSLSSTHLTKEIGSFAIDKAKSLKLMVDQSPEVKEIFNRKDCVFD